MEVWIKESSSHLRSQDLNWQLTVWHHLNIHQYTLYQITKWLIDNFSSTIMKIKVSALIMAIILDLQDEFSALYIKERPLSDNPTTSRHLPNTAKHKNHENKSCIISTVTEWHWTEQLSWIRPPLHKSLKRWEQLRRALTDARHSLFLL